MGPGLTVVGVSAHFHDAACCILRDGELVAAAQEERFTRRKHDPSIPIAAFRYCLDAAEVTIDEVDVLAYYEDPVAKLGRQLWMGLPDVPPVTPGSLLRLDATRPEREIRTRLGYEGPIHWSAHHRSHAASAYLYSGFPDAAILTVDAVGEWTTTSYGRGAGATLELLEEVAYPHSLGLLYSTITSFLGFDVNDAEYKVMGLAPYGSPRYVDEVRRLVSPGPGGQFRLDLDYFDFSGGVRMYSERLVELFGRPPRRPESELDESTADIAASLQVVLEEVLVEKVRWLYERVPSPRLCLAGGVALNCVAVARLVAEGPFAEIFVQPAAGDAGSALGAAALAHADATGLAPAPLRHLYLGPAATADDVAALLAGSAVAAADHRGREDDLLQATAEHLARGAAVGWFQGRMEFGPRALGNRSILGDPRDPGMRDRINALVKKREGFRPFAPAVLEEEVASHFVVPEGRRLPYMLETVAVRRPEELPAVAHVDGSARVQTVGADTNPRFHRLLRAFADRTGCPVLLNTSFNLRGEPIVGTPADALICFVRSDLDVLVLEDHLIERSSLPSAWLRWFRDAPQASAAVSNAVYTLL